MRTLLPTTTLLFALMVMAGCAADTEPKAKDPVTFGTAAPATTRLAITAPAGDVVPAGSWPSACQFLTDDDIVALLPQARTIKRAPQKVSVTSLRDKRQNQSAAEGSCLYGFWLKGATIEDVTSSVRVTIVAVADPDIIAEHYTDVLGRERIRPDRPHFEDHAGKLGPQACYSWLYAGPESQIVCRQGPLMFEVAGMGFGTFSGLPDQPATPDVAALHWQDKVQAPVAALIAAKVP